MDKNLKDVGEQFQEQGKKILDNIGNLINKSPETQLVEIIILMMIGLVIVIFVFWAYGVSSLQDRDCQRLAKIYSTNNDNIRPISTFTRNSGIPGVNYRPVNILFAPNNGNGRVFSYFVKTAFNACSPGNFSNSFVSICALRNNIELGARCLDFEIYSIDLEPVVSTSSVSSNLASSFFVKETFNYIKLRDVLLFIKYFALESAGGGAVNHTDPLFLHFRIMTNQAPTINLIAKQLRETIGDNLLDSAYGQNNYDTSIRDLPLIHFSNKCIIMVNKNTTMQNDATIASSDLWSLTNVFTGSDNYRFYRYSSIKNMSEDELQDLSLFNETNMSIVVPDSGTENMNFDSRVALRSGCQFIAMNFQSFDANLETYFSIFGEVGYSFILKPCSLRYIPRHVLIDTSNMPQGAACSVENNNGETRMIGTPI